MGGYYDIDFALMYLRLKGAGIFFKVLNTPERIDVIEKMGHLEREDADFLREAATFYRAVDHSQRIATGHAEGSLPASPAQLEGADQPGEALDAGTSAPPAHRRHTPLHPPADARFFRSHFRALMKTWRFAASLLIVGAILALYRLAIPVNSTTVALTLLLAILFVSARWGLAEATVRR